MKKIFGFNSTYGLGFGRGNVFGFDSSFVSFANVCMTVDNDATWYGYTQAFGALIPTTLKNGQTITETKAKADGSWVIKIDAGVQITDVDEIYLTSNDGDIIVVLVWDSGSGTYLATDVEEAVDLIAEDGNEVCFGFYILPDLFIDITFGELET